MFTVNGKPHATLCGLVISTEEFDAIMAGDSVILASGERVEKGLTREQRREVRSLVEDSGYTRSEAEALVRAGVVSR